MAIAGIIPVAKWLAKIKQRSDVSCRLCNKAREQRGASTENLIGSRESLTEKAADIEKTIVVKEHESARYDFDPTMFYENRFWNRRPDGIVINKYHRTLYILEFKRSSYRNKDFLRVKED